MDLIAMATHGRGEVAWVLGSTAEKVVSHATVPVLLYRIIKTGPPRLKES
jgi:nucleotide-binding universal stress UspA family protein